MKALLALLFRLGLVAQSTFPPADSAIHRAIFGVKLIEQCDAVGATCILRLQYKPEVTPEPEAFLIEQLTRL